MEKLIEKDDKLYYHHHVGDNVVFYEVNYDINELKSLRNHIIKCCGIRKHIVRNRCSYEPDVEPILIENFHQKKIGEVDYEMETVDQYYQEYDQIIRPRLVVYIDNFIDLNDESLIEYLYFDKTLRNQYMDYLNSGDRKNLVTDIYNMLTVDHTDFDAVNEKVKKLELIDKEYDINIKLHLQDQNDYKDALKKAVTLTRVDEIEFEAYEKVLKYTSQD